MYHSLLLSLALMGPDTMVVDSTQRDTLRSVNAQSITVVADQAPRASNARTSPSVRTIDQLMELASASMTRRAAIASEPTIRGLHAGQVALTIDGMKIHAACVDHMDPPTAYMELASLDKLDVQRGTEDMRYGANLGGALTFTVKKPELDAPTSVATAVSGESNSTARTGMIDLGTSADDVAVRAAYTYRAADDFSAGHGQIVSGSHFEKHNLTAGATWRFAPLHTLSAEFINDVATFIGFPALLMDTRRAVGHIGSLTWKGAWASGLHTSVKAYANSIDHVMDDYARPVAQIQSRKFMSNMYMPMQGRSATYGLLLEASQAALGGFVSVILDASWLKARADMTMFPLDTSVTTMHLVNIGDASIGNVGTMVRYDTQLDDVWDVTVQGRIDISPRTLQDPVAQSVLLAYTPNAMFDRTLMGLSGVMAVNYRASEPVSTRLSLSTSQRMPSHLEQYGFYLYDPQSMFTTIGAPTLNPERSFNLESSTTYRTELMAVSVSAFVQRITDYIAPDSKTQFLSGTMPPERIFGNVGGALLGGFDATARFQVTEILIAEGLVGYVTGRFTDIDDRMPMIPPLYYRLRCVIGTGNLTGEISAQGAITQTAISTVVRPENATSAWCIGNAAVNWQPTNNIQVGVSLLNVFDALYHDHLSVNDLPSPGRSLRFVVGTRW